MGVGRALRVLVCVRYNRGTDWGAVGWSMGRRNVRGFVRFLNRRCLHLIFGSHACDSWEYWWGVGEAEGGAAR